MRKNRATCVRVLAQVPRKVPCYAEFRGTERSNQSERACDPQYRWQDGYRAARSRSHLFGTLERERVVLSRRRGSVAPTSCANPSQRRVVGGGSGQQEQIGRA